MLATGAAWAAEVYHNSDRLSRYFVDMVHTVCRGLLIRQPWTLPMSWSVVKSLGLRTTMLQLLPKDSCPRCWFQNRVRVSPGSIRGEPGVVVCQHKVSCPRDNKKLREKRKKQKQDWHQRRRENHPTDEAEIQSRLKTFLEGHCQWTNRVDATHVSVLKKSAAAHCCATFRQISMAFTALGMKSESRATVAAGRILTRSSVRRGEDNCLRLLSDSEKRKCLEKMVVDNA